MLTDTERKLLRILWSLYGNAWIKPDIDRICRLSVRPPDQVRAAVKGLIGKEYVELKPGFIRVIQSCERQKPAPPRWVSLD